MRISDWSSDVCSSDLLVVTRPVLARADRPIGTHMAENEIGPDGHHLVTGEPDPPGGGHADIVMDDIRPPNETFNNIGRVRRLQIERERPLSSLRAEKDRKSVV